MLMAVVRSVNEKPGSRSVSRNLLDLQPVESCGTVDDQGHIESERGLHFPSDQCHQRLEFVFGDLEDQFIMDLQQHRSRMTVLLQRPVDTDHGLLDQVGG